MNKRYFLITTVIVGGALVGSVTLGCEREKMSPHMPPHVFKHMDSNDNDVVSKEEALSFITKQFAALDKDNDNVITQDEARNGAEGHRRRHHSRYED